MKVEIRDENVISTCATHSNAMELIKLTIHMFINKLWKIQIIFLLLYMVLGIGLIILFSTFVYYDTIKELRRQSDLASDTADNVEAAIISSKKVAEKSRTGQLYIPLLTRSLKRVPVYYDDGLRSEWNFEITKNYQASRLHTWIEPPMQLPIDGRQGENGTGFIASPELRPLMKKLHAENNFNLLASQMISVNRSLPDVRSVECRDLTYPEKLPTTSIIIVFHNEAWSTLIRTIWSVINRSPRELIAEFILVDDFNTDNSLKRSLDDYIKKLPIQTTIIRTRRREGLIRSRMLGAEVAKGDVLTFFDAHIECTRGWLQPILARIASDRSVVAVPTVDRISLFDFAYQPYANAFGIIGFRWHLIFSNMTIPQREIERTNNDRTAPLRTPTHIGCAFSIDREFFYEIGSYDEKMDIWGSENLEMAIRVWQCGGAVELMPCSHVGHLFRTSKYSFNGDSSEITARNNVRLVEVWMDEYKKLFYAANPRSKGVSPGDLTDRINLRKRLRCKSFQWYLENVYPESNWLREYLLLSEIVSVSDSKCLDVYMANSKGEFSVFGCHEMGGNQFFAFAKDGHIVTVEEKCVSSTSNKKSLRLADCSEHDLSQLWKYDDQHMWIVNVETNQCISNVWDKITLKNCDSKDVQMKWDLRFAE